MCVLRERGESAAAETLSSGSLAAMIASLRPGLAEEAAFEQRLAAIFAAEEERVANASALAELLLPLLAQSTPLFGNGVARHFSAVDSSVSTPPVPDPPPARRAPTDIAAFLDDMIAQERTETTSPSSHRRAS